MRPLSQLSVVIPVWGEYRQYVPTLVEVLVGEGVLRQQIFVIWNGESIANLDCREISIPKKSTIGEVRNIGLTYIETPLVCFCDADDRPVPAALDKLYSRMIETNYLIAASGMIVKEDFSEYPWPGKYATKSYSSRERLLLQLAFNHISMVTGTIIRTKAVRRAGGFPHWNLGEDGALACILTWLGVIEISLKPTRIYKAHKLGLMQRGHSFKEWYRNSQALRKYIQNHPRLPRQFRVLMFFYIPIHLFNSYYLARKARYH
jgi:glycosyltransferase involved in cell wall biosynthesis